MDTECNGPGQNSLPLMEEEPRKILWTRNVGKPLFSSVAASRWGYCVGCVDHCVYMFAKDSGIELWRFATGGPVFSSPCIALMSTADDAAELRDAAEPRDAAELCDAAEPRDAAELRDAAEPRDAAELRDAAEPHDVVICGSHDHYVYCLTASNGRLLWKTKLNSQVYSTPFWFNLFGKTNSLDANIRVSEDKLGTDLTSTNNSVPLMGHETVAKCDVSQLCGSTSLQNCVAVCSTDGTVYILDICTGTVLTEWKLPVEVFSSPVVIGNKLVVGCRDDSVYCFTIAVI